MYAAMSKAFLPKLFARVVPFPGGDIHVRQLHHILMWGFILFAIIHIYLVFYHDYIERRGVTSSMIGLKDLIDSAFLLGNVPQIFLIAISIKDFQEMGVELSPEVNKAIPAVIQTVKELVETLRK
jgi:hypothetical protein